MVHAAVSLSLQRLGLLIKFIIGMLDSIQKTVHNIRTGFGDSTMTYGGEDILAAYKHHLQGLHQGNGAGPTIWSIVSSIIFKILRERGYGTQLLAALLMQPSVWSDSPMSTTVIYSAHPIHWIVLSIA